MKADLVYGQIICDDNAHGQTNYCDDNANVGIDFLKEKTYRLYMNYHFTRDKRHQLALQTAGVYTQGHAHRNKFINSSPTSQIKLCWFPAEDDSSQKGIFKGTMKSSK